jgi:hypothetical protein
MGIYTDYVAAALLHNLQILPETLMCGLVILAIVLASPPVVTLAASMAGAQLLVGAMGRIVMNFQPEQAVVSTASDSCRAGFIGKSWDRILRGTAAPELLWHPLAPSTYTATVGFLAGWGYALNQLYKDEINAGVLSAATMMAAGIVMALILVLAVVFRVFSGCDTAMGAISGVVVGLLLAYFGAVSIGYATDRRLTNIWGIPLLRDRINDGQPVYVCDA